MKRILSIISVFALLLTSCVGDQGPPGFDGFDGQNGETAPAFETDFINFTSGNDYNVIVEYPFEVFSGEVTLVYILWEDNAGEDQDIWRLIPQTVIFEDGNDLVYNFDHTQIDVSLFLEGSNLDILDSAFTQDQVFRIVVIPTTNFNRLDTSDLKAVMKSYNIKSFQKI